MPLIHSNAPFLFKSQLSLVMLTGFKARNLLELRDYLKDISELSLYYHTHHFLHQHQYLTPEPPNDFAYWVSETLQEEEMGERLAAIDTVRFSSLQDLRHAIAGSIDEYLAKKLPLREAPPGDEFYFKKSILFSLPTAYKAYDLKEFLECLKKVSTSCLYNHIFEARLRPPLGVTDFTFWLENSLSEPALAQKIQRMDPYTQTMEGLRSRLIAMIEKRLEEHVSAVA